MALGLLLAIWLGTLDPIQVRGRHSLIGATDVSSVKQNALSRPVRHIFRWLNVTATNFNSSGSI